MRERLAEGGIDLILLDIGLPGEDGLTLAREVRSKSSVPIIIITGKGDVVDRVVGLELGADDYVCKPFSPREVVAGKRADLGRRGIRNKDAQSSALTIDGDRHLARYKGQPLDLTPVEFALLNALYAAPGRVFSREQLMDRMYSDYRVVSDRAVDTHVKNLRRKLEAVAPGTELIESVYSLGYRYAS